MKADKSKIMEMVKQLGNTTIDSLMTWFPNSKKKDLLNIINKSSNLVLVGDEVVLKVDNNSLELDNLSLDELICIIDNYNEREQKRYNKLTAESSLLERKINAVLEHLKNYYTVSPMDNLDTEFNHIYSLKKIHSDTLSLYAIIVDVFTEDVLYKLEQIFSNEPLLIYYISSMNKDFSLNNYNNDYYFKEAKEFIKEYIIDYKLEKSSKDIIKIKSIKGADICGN
ncbi:MAG: hypothetical protein FH762_09735 [Firmicutes bacterium]|nr:hypothetical protein [Bacillota bacterium]